MEAKKSFGDAIVSQELNKEAWKKLSREFKWNEELLRKYCGEIDWEVLSSNTEMLWSASILENFKNYTKCVRKDKKRVNKTGTIG